MSDRYLGSNALWHPFMPGFLKPEVIKDRLFRAHPIKASPVAAQALRRRTTNPKAGLSADVAGASSNFGLLMPENFASADCTCLVPGISNLLLTCRDASGYYGPEADRGGKC